MRLHYVRHVPYEGLGHIEPWARGRGFEIVESRPFDGDRLPDPHDADVHVVLGGPMGVRDIPRVDWLVEEARWMERLLAAERPVLAICLGAQMMAAVLGSEVRAHVHPEIGWHRVEPTPAGRSSVLAPFFEPGAEVMQWHYDTFELPEGAVHLARSEGCENQAFSLGDHACAVQFHPEMTRDEVATLVDRDGPLPEGPLVSEPARLLEPSRFERLASRTAVLLDRLAAEWSLA